MIGFFFFFRFGSFVVRALAHLLLHLRAHLDLRSSRASIRIWCALPPSSSWQRSSGDLMIALNSNATIANTHPTTAMSTVLDGATGASPSWSSRSAIRSWPGSSWLCRDRAGHRAAQSGIRATQRLMYDALQAQSRRKATIVQYPLGHRDAQGARGRARALERLVTPVRRRGQLPPSRRGAAVRRGSTSVLASLADWAPPLADPRSSARRFVPRRPTPALGLCSP